jgi:hypothetical protein
MAEDPKPTNNPAPQTQNDTNAESPSPIAIPQPDRTIQMRLTGSRNPDDRTIPKPDSSLPYRIALSQPEKRPKREE